MDILKAIHDLYVEKKKLDRVIVALEDFERAGRSSPFSDLGGKRRGRKSMNAEERLQVSQRMKKNWAGRRKRKGKPPRHAGASPGGTARP